MVLAHGNAPRSIGYQPIALLLSYTRENWRRAEDLRLNRRGRSVCFRNSVRASADSLSRKDGGEQWSCPTSLAARIGFQPITALRGFTLLKIGGGERSCSPSRACGTSPLQTGAGASSGFASESPRGRICTCVDPLRRRRPELLGHAEKMDLAAGLPPTTRRSKRRMIVISPREEKVVPSRGLAPRSRASRARVLSLGR